MPVDGDIILKAGLNTKPVKSALDDLHKSVNKGFKNLLRYGLGVRSMYALIRKLRKALTEGFGDLAQVSEPFNAAMSSIKNALAGLKSSFASAFAPIIEFVAPALTTFINMVAKAVDAIGMLIAALTGQKTYIKAIPAQQDYAASVDKTAKSAKSASDNLDDASASAKKLQRQLAGFDDVEILHSPDESGSGSSGGGGGAGSGISSVETPLSEAFSSLSDLLKKAWENADFYDIGRIVGEKLRDALLSIPWETIKETLRKIAKSAATFLNGYFETPGLFEAIGKTIAQGINSAFEFLNTFIVNFNWDSFGTAIRTRIISALTNLDWGLIYSTLSNFGTGLAEYLNSLLTEDTFVTIGDSLAKVLNAAFRFLDNFGDTFEFTNFGTSLARGINRFLREFDVDRLAYGINKFIYGFRDAIIAFMENVNWYDLGLKIRNLLVKIDWKAALSAVGKFIWEAINAAITTLRELFNTDVVENPVTEALERLQATIDKLGEDIDFDGLAKGVDALVTALKPAIQGFAAGLIDFFNVLINAGEGLLNLLGPMFQGIADALNSLDPLLLEQIGTALGIIAGALLTINGLTAVAGIIKKVAGAVGTLIGVGGGGAAAGAAGGAAAGAAGGGLAGLASHFKGLLPVVGKVAGVVSVAAATFEATSVTMGDADRTAEALNDTYLVMRDAVKESSKQFELNNAQLSDLATALARVATDEGPEAERAFGMLQGVLANTGISADDLLASLDDTLNLNVDQTGASRIREALNEIGTSADTSKESTGGLQGAFDAFDSLGFSVPLKIALLSGAVKLLGENNKLSQEDVEKLQKALDNYETNPTEEAMGAVKEAFDNAGVSVADFDSALTRSGSSLRGKLRREFNTVRSEMRGSGAGGSEGFAEGLESKSGMVTDAAHSIAQDDTIGVLEDDLQENSPSKRLNDIGQNAIQGLINGIEQKENLLTTTMKTLANSLIKTLEATYSQFSNIGMQIISNIFTGMNGSVNNVISLVYNMIYSIQGSFYSMDWYSIGSNIGNGIYNGLASSANRLAVLAWNVAVNMFNSARNALGIRSPSKKFAWIGEMVSTGLGEGVEDKAGLAVSKLQTLLTTLENLGSATTIPMPDVAMGKIAPYSTSVTNKQDAQSLSSITDAVESMHNDALTREDILEIVNTAMRNFTVDLYIGDEQIARHANNGNLKLSRRYGMVT